jgi:hypothetical protein
VVARGVQVGNSTSLLWNVPSLGDGAYKVRLVADGKETFYLPAERPETPPCFEDGETLPGVSAEFRISNLRALSPTRDRYPPLGVSDSSSITASLLLLLLSGLVMYLD